jgi:hypothetical protein
MILEIRNDLSQTSNNKFSWTYSKSLCEEHTILDILNEYLTLFCARLQKHWRVNKDSKHTYFQYGISCLKWAIEDKGIIESNRNISEANLSQTALMKFIQLPTIVDGTRIQTIESTIRIDYWISKQMETAEPLNSLKTKEETYHFFGTIIRENRSDFFIHEGLLDMLKAQNPHSEKSQFALMMEENKRLQKRIFELSTDLQSESDKMKRSLEMVQRERNTKYEECELLSIELGKQLESITKLKEVRKIFKEENLQLREQIQSQKEYFEKGGTELLKQKIEDLNSIIKLLQNENEKCFQDFKKNELKNQQNQEETQQILSELNSIRSENSRLQRENTELKARTELVGKMAFFLEEKKVEARGLRQDAQLQSGKNSAIGSAKTIYECGCKSTFQNLSGLKTHILAAHLAVPDGTIGIGPKALESLNAALAAKNNPLLLNIDEIARKKKTPSRHEGKERKLFFSPALNEYAATEDLLQKKIKKN